MEQWRPIPPEDRQRAETPSSARSTGDTPSALVGHLLQTIRWWGWGRILTVAVCVPLVGWGAYFLVRSPEPPVEASLAYATTVPLTSAATGGAGSTADGVGTRTEPERPEQVTVHVAGHVVSPGVYRLAHGSRVVDAVRAAGGGTTTADLSSVNLASPLNDGQQVYLPAIGERAPGAAATLDDGVATESEPSVQLPLDVNRATVEELEFLPGIGPTTAAAIIEHRQRHGRFVTVAGLLEVPGIGPVKLAALAGLIVV